MKGADIFQILCVDDDEEVLNLLVESIQELGYQCTGLSNPDKALAWIPTNFHNLALIISDFNLDSSDAFQFRSSILKLEDIKDIPFAIISGHITREHALEALDLKISGFCEKPFSREKLKQLIDDFAQGRIDALKEEREMVGAFVSDADTLIEEMESLLLGLESNPGDMESINRIFGAAHTIKGSSGFFYPKTIHKFTHKYEDFLSYYKKNLVPVSPAAISILLQGLDTIKMLLAKLKSGDFSSPPLEELISIFQHQENEAPAPASPPSVLQNHPQKPAIERHEEIKVAVKVLDHFMELSGEITVIRNMINKLVAAIEKEYVFNKNVSLLSELLEEMHKINGQMQERVVDLRKVSVRNIFRPLGRAVRDLSQNLQKEVDLQTSGEDLRVDTSIAEILNNSLIHLIRNCMDHGLEPNEDRIALGKPQKGLIRICTQELNQEIVLSVSDDGRGLNLDVIRRKVVEKGLRPEAEAAKMTADELHMMIFESGFSTAAQITDVSGRGVGMDMVRNSVTRGGGRIEVLSKTGVGTTFKLIMPIPKAVTIITSLLVKSGSHTIAVPQEHLLRVVSILHAIKIGAYKASENADFLLADDGTLIPILNLLAILENRQRDFFKAPIPYQNTPILIIGTEKNGAYAVIIDEILHSEDTVVKKLGGHLKEVRLFQGATFLGDGRVGLIIDSEQLSTYAFDQKRSGQIKQPSQINLSDEGKDPARDILVFRLHVPGLYGVALEDVARIEAFEQEDIQWSGQSPAVVYGGVVTPLITPENLLQFQRATIGNKNPLVLMLKTQNFPLFGIIINEVMDIVTTSTDPDELLKDRKGILGAVVHNQKTITVLSAFELFSMSNHAA